MRAETVETAPLLEEADFVAQFESCTLSTFHHRDHVRLAWIYLKSEPPLAALTRFAEGLQRFARHHGKHDLYHETITWAFLFLIRERMERMGPDATWEDFAEANPDLFAWKPSILDQYYQSETLRSDLARRVFVMPDRLNRISSGSGPGGSRSAQLPPSRPGGAPG